MDCRDIQPTLLRVPGIYQITNTVNGKVYIGSAVDLYTRAHSHLSLLRDGRHSNTYLQAAWNKYGADAFAFEVLEVLDSKAETLACEQCWMDATRAAERAYGYNLNRLAQSRLGMSPSAETREKLRQANLGKKAPPQTIAAMQEALARRRAERGHSMLGHKHTDEAKEKISEAARTMWVRRKAAEVRPETHVCPKCGVEKPFTREFYSPGERNRWGLKPSYCKTCHAEYHRNKRADLRNAGCPT